MFASHQSRNPSGPLSGAPDAPALSITIIPSPCVSRCPFCYLYAVLVGNDVIAAVVPEPVSVLFAGDSRAWLAAGCIPI